MYATEDRTTSQQTRLRLIRLWQLQHGSVTICVMFSRTYKILVQLNPLVHYVWNLGGEERREREREDSKRGGDREEEREDMGKGKERREGERERQARE